MNNKAYRLVYSRLRGMVVAVEEAANAAGQSAGGETRAHRRSMSSGTVMAAAVVMIGAIPPVTLAQIVPAPGTSTQVIQTPNGLPQVNVARRSDAGVSVNTYNQFDMQKAGAILNNSPTIVNTQQAGMINGKPNYGPGQARPRASSSTRSTAATRPS